MAKKSMVARDDKRASLNKKYATKRAELKKALKNKELDLQERLALTWKLDNLPKDSAKERQRNRCVLTGRPRGYYRKFGLSRIELRRLAGEGEIPGLIKSSW